MSGQSTSTQPVEKVGVVYFHGMGEQRRFEELSRLVDSLERYARKYPRDGTLFTTAARLRETKNDGSYVGYVLCRYGPSKTTPPAAQLPVNFYEVYWAPKTADGVPPRKVLMWMMSRLTRPFSISRSKWTQRQRWRRSLLFGLMPHLAGPGKPFKHTTFAQLNKLYRDFGEDCAKNTESGGTYEEFLAFIDKAPDLKTSEKDKVKSLAKRWRGTHRWSQVKNIFFLFTLAAGMGLATFCAYLIAMTLLTWGGDMGMKDLLTAHGLSKLAERLVATPANAQALVGGALSLFAGRFLSRYLGDVQFWTTYEETNSKHQIRRSIVDEGTKILAQVLKSDCTRVVVVAHSLGTAIAQECLLEAARRNRAHTPADAFQGEIMDINKLEHFITLASPIDKIHYLFESTTSRYFLYGQIIDGLRGDISSPPFSKNRKPHMHWINFWDVGDPISGSIESVSSPDSLFLTVDNRHVSNFLFPNPGASHSAYFNNVDVVRQIFLSIFKREGAFQTVPRPKGSGPDYKSVFGEPGTAPPWPRVQLGCMCILPWAGLAYAVTKALGGPTLIPFVPLSIATGLLAIGFVISWLHGHRDPIS